MPDMTMDRTYLVQRLNRPFRREGLVNPFSFGGGLKNGGLSDEAMGLVSGIFSFDYMGSAEFEFGAVPEAFQRIAKASETPGLVSFAIDIPLSDVQPHWEEIPPRAKPETRKHWKTDGSARVWVMCPEGWEDEVERRIRDLATERYNRDLKETSGVAGALRPYHEWEAASERGATVGWLELDNGFMFFIDEEMWASTCELFGARPR